MRPRECSCDILLKNMADFFPCLKNMLEAKLKSLGLMVLSKEISGCSGIDLVMWLLVVTLTQIYNEKKQAEQEKLQNVFSEEKRNTGKCNRAKFCTEGDKQFKEKPNDWRCTPLIPEFQRQTQVDL